MSESLRVEPGMGGRSERLVDVRGGRGRLRGRYRVGLARERGELLAERVEAGCAGEVHARLRQAVLVEDDPGFVDVLPPERFGHRGLGAPRDEAELAVAVGANDD